EDIQHRMLFRTRAQVMQHLALLTFTKAGNLLVVTTQEGKSAMRSTSAQHRAGNHSVRTWLQLASAQLIQVRPKTGAYQTRAFHHWTGQGYDALHRNVSRREQLADSDYVLIADTPDAFARAYRIKEANVCTCQTCRMRAGKCFGADLGQVFTLQAAFRGLAQEDLGQVAKHLKSGFGVCRLLTDDHSTIGRQRMGIDRCNENRSRCGIDGRHLAVGPGAQSSPEARLLQVFSHLCVAERL